MIASKILSCLTVGSFITTASIHAASAEDETIAKAIDAYIYGYPLVTMEMTKRVSTNVTVPDGSFAPVGQFANLKSYPDASFTAVTAPNADTLYSAAWLDVGPEPIILHVPDENDRYYLMPMLSGWTDVFADPGTRTTGTKAADFAITGPNWKGTLPQGVTEFKSPTNMVWILGRTYCSGTPEDYERVHEIQKQYTLTPLSAFGKGFTPAQNSVDSNIDMTTPVRKQVNQLDGASYFNLLAKLLVDNPPSPNDKAIVAKLTDLGIEPGKPFDPNKNPQLAKILADLPKNAQKVISGHAKDAGELKNGWTFSLHTGKYGTDYLQRAYVTMVGLGANLPEDAIYPVAVTDDNGIPLEGSKKYVVHFDKGALPPVKGFWSLTMYNDKFYFVENPINRYNVSSRTPFVFNADGSLDIYLQNEAPAKDKEPNWLPAPKGAFVLMLRAYWPEAGLLDGSWQLPKIIETTPKP